MKILALEFSSGQRSVAVIHSIGDWRSAIGYSSSAQPHSRDAQPAPPSISEVIETGAPGAHPIGMIEAALREAQIEREQIDCLAVGLGPGSYNGIRMAIAVAQGWQLGCPHVKLLGIGSHDCLAVQAQAQGLRGRVTVLIDAQRGEFYVAPYDLTPQDAILLAPLRLAARAASVESALAGERFIGPVADTFSGGMRLFPSAAALGGLALGRSDFKPGEQLEPIYLRETAFVKAPPPRLVP
jgi:tRNA threonylcarbamoyl adenosine modification protein YeaZ